MTRTPLEKSPFTSATTSPSENHLSLEGFLRREQIITFALIQSVVFITAIMAYLAFWSGDWGPANAAPSDDDTVLVAIGAAVCFGGCFASFVVNRLMRAAAIQQFVSAGEEVEVSVQESMAISSRIRELLAASQTRTIVCLALVEGAAVINAMLMMLDANLTHLVMIAFCFVAMVLQFPTLQKKLDLIEFAVRASQDQIG